MRATTPSSPEPAPQPSPAAHTELAITGMNCGNCIRHVTDAIQNVPGVASAVVTLDPQHATVRWNTTPNVPALVQAIQQAGYEAQPMAEAPSAHDHGEHRAPRWQLTLWLGVLGTAPLMAGEWFSAWARKKVT